MSLKANISPGGHELILRALSAQANIKFTGIAFGNGTDAGAYATRLSNQILGVGISSITRGDVFVTLTTEFSNEDIASGFRATELGVLAEDPDTGDNLLFAYRYMEESRADYIPDPSDAVVETVLSILVYVGDAENVTATISDSLAYASREALDAHIEDRGNPHNVTKEQVGLENVPNLGTNDQTPTYQEAAALTPLVSGEKLGTAFGKLAKGLSSMITHLSSSNNPHKVTAAQAGAAPKSHPHSTTDLTSGVLGIARGGTGVTTYKELLSKIGAAAASHVHNASSITAGILAVARGGTGVGSYSELRTAIEAAHKDHKHAAADITGLENLDSAGVVSHISSTENPHKVTKGQVGLGNVPNVATNDQVPTFTANTSMAALSSGEKLSTLLGKIAGLYSKAVTHINSRANPHNVTLSQISDAQKYINYHWWQKGRVGTKYRIGQADAGEYYYKDSGDSYDIEFDGATLYYADRITINENTGVISLVDPVLWNSAEDSDSVLFNKYIYSPDGGIRVRPNSGDYTVVTDVILFPGDGDNTTVGMIYSEAEVAYAVPYPAIVGDVEYVQSASRSTYPDCGEKDGYFYQYVGVLDKQAASVPRMVRGVYTGEGLYGEEHPNILTFDFKPDFVVVQAITEASFSSENSSGGYAVMIRGVEWFSNTCIGSVGGEAVDVEWGDNYVKWWCDNDNGYSDNAHKREKHGHAQLNQVGRAYFYIAFGTGTIQ